MEPTNTYEQEIDLKDLMFAVLHKWRPILLTAVILAVVLGGYKAVSVYKQQNDAEIIKESEETYEEALKVYEKNKETCEREIDNLLTDIDNQQKYLEESILMNMSAYDVWEADTELFVKTDYVIMPNMVYQNVDYTNTILSAYKSALTNTEFLDDIAEKAGIETRYLKELIDITAADNLITIKVKHNEEKAAKTLMKDILKGVEASQAKIAESIGAHTVSTVNSSIGSMVDLDLAGMQKTERDRLIELNDSLEAKQAEQEELEEPKKAATSASAAVRSGVKYAVLGGVLGAFMVIFYCCVVFLMSDKLYSEKELRNRFKLKILGVLPAGKPAKGIDAWLNRLEGRTCKDESQAYSLIAANIRNYAESAGTLLVAGNAREELIKTAAGRIAKELGNGVEVIAGGDLLQNVNALKLLPEVDGVVLVEQCSVSNYGKIELEIEKVLDLQKEVIGCVVLE